ncbi:MAG: SMC family ATPase [Microbacterium sp.]
MRLHTLELTGFGPFRQTQRVDFDAFCDDGVFLISGRTGAGKSSILDGVSFALYGTVPRYEGGERRLRSDHCATTTSLTDPTEVRLEFTVGDERWRVTRSPEYERPAKRGGGLTTEAARAELEQLVGGQWIGRAAKPRTVGELLAELLGLNAQQFQQVILLAQNKFARFLLASGEERQTLLRTLFGTRRFEQYRDDLDQRRRDAQRALDAAEAHARTLLELAEQLVAEERPGIAESGVLAVADSFLGRRGALEVAQSRADERVERAAAARKQASAAAEAAVSAHAALTERAARSREGATLRARLDDLEARAPQIAADRERLARGRAAEVLRAVLEAVDRADDAATRAAEVEATALTAWLEGGGEASADPAARIDELTADLARWEAAAEHERALDGLRARREAQAAALTQTDALLAQLDDLMAALPAQRADLDERIASARVVAARSDDLQRRLAEAIAHLAAARDVTRLAEQSAVAEDAHLAASAEASGAAVAVTVLLQRRLAGFAGELSAALVDGEPCAVCGSVEHPNPATPTADAVTDDDLAVAERARDATSVAATTAAEAARVAREALGAARALTGGHDEVSAAAAVGAATRDADAAAEAARELEELTVQLARLDDLAVKTQSERAVVARRRVAEREAQLEIDAELARADAAVAAARGGFATVAARIMEAQRERERARALAEARAAVAESGRAAATARADCDARLRESPFADAADARAALISAGELARLDQQLTDDASELKATRDRLSELERTAPGEDVSDDEVAASAAAASTADTTRVAAIAAERDAQHAADRLRELTQRIDAACVDVEEIADEAASITRLADTVAGRAPNTMKMDLETFVLAAELEEIVAAANLRLSEMSAGRYTLHHSDARAARGRASGLGIEVLDAHTGRLRPPQSLSGGETFLASLALALGLGQVVTSRAGGIRIDTLFVDEGFGSLDPETLELAMRTLDELRDGGRTVGVISHVEAMKDQLPAQLVVEATSGGPSIIRQDGA